ncbi:Glucosaminyl phosphatidylinositol (GlcN-PI) nositol acylation protein [Myotisia sp. PD_48]|nr:Glucosaminyl phosphatidylinositol (GlcN-PI) nositol acylation protein [Myotisia sp. PD_48]
MGLITTLLKNAIGPRYEYFVVYETSASDSSSSASGSTVSGKKTGYIVRQKRESVQAMFGPANSVSGSSDDDDFYPKPYMGLLGPPPSGPPGRRRPGPTPLPPPRGARRDGAGRKPPGGGGGGGGGGNDGPGPGKRRRTGYKVATSIVKPAPPKSSTKGSPRRGGSPSGPTPPSMKKSPKSSVKASPKRDGSPFGTTPPSVNTSPKSSAKSSPKSSVKSSPNKKRERSASPRKNSHVPSAEHYQPTNMTSYASDSPDHYSPHSSLSHYASNSSDHYSPRDDLTFYTSNSQNHYSAHNPTSLYPNVPKPTAPNYSAHAQPMHPQSQGGVHTDHDSDEEYYNEALYDEVAREQARIRKQIHEQKLAHEEMLEQLRARGKKKVRFDPVPAQTQQEFHEPPKVILTPQTHVGQDAPGPGWKRSESYWEDATDEEEAQLPLEKRKPKIRHYRWTAPTQPGSKPLSPKSGKSSNTRPPRPISPTNSDPGGRRRSNVWDINSVALVVPSAVLLWSVLQSRCSFFTPYEPTALIADFLLNCGAILFATTLYSSNLLLLNILLISPAILILLNTRPKSNHRKAKPTALQSSAKPTTALDALPRRPFLTHYRGSMMVVTCISILAVDFKIYPRRFAKVENWGVSFMDLGVGSFVFSGGVVSARSILNGARSSQGSLGKRLLASTRHSIPLFILGLIRLYSVKGLDYAEHVTEYGVHWNFFFTLALMPPFVEIFAIIPWYELLALVVAGGYQVALESTNLKEYILVSPRGPSLLSKNREGVFSFLGYLAIFLAGRGIGLRVMPRKSRKALLSQLATWSLIWSTLFIFNTTYTFGVGAGLSVSRRLANLPYVLGVIAFNTVQLLLFCLVEMLFFPSLQQGTNKNEEAEQAKFATSKVMDAFNENGLPIFLIANLFTGAVNLGMNTLDASKAVAMAVLIGYSAILMAIALGLKARNIKLKL